jgi:uncharacterized protein YegP (UPF0339 family)
MIFEVYKEQNKEYFFRLADENGEPLLLSKGYKSKGEIYEVVNTVKKSVTDPAGIAKDETKEGDYFFMVIGPTGRIVCKSTMFYSSENRDKWINDFQRLLPQLDIVEV